MGAFHSQASLAVHCSFPPFSVPFQDPNHRPRLEPDLIGVLRYTRRGHGRLARVPIASLGIRLAVSALHFRECRDSRVHITQHHAPSRLKRVCQFVSTETGPPVAAVLRPIHSPAAPVVPTPRPPSAVSGAQLTTQRNSLQLRKRLPHLSDVVEQSFDRLRPPARPAANSSTPVAVSSGRIGGRQARPGAETTNTPSQRLCRTRCSHSRWYRGGRRGRPCAVGYCHIVYGEPSGLVGRSADGRVVMEVIDRVCCCRARKEVSAW